MKISHALLLSSLACACHSKSEPPRAQVTTKPSASSAPTPASSSSAAPKATEEASALPVERPKKSLALKLALAEFPPEFQSNYGRGVFGVHGVRGGTIVTLAESLYALEEGKLMEIPISVGQQRLGNMMIGPIYAELDRVAGRYPNDLWVSASGMWLSDGARLHSAWSGVYKQANGEWLEVATDEAGDGLALFTSWSGGRTVARNVFGFSIVSGSKKQAIPLATPGKTGTPRLTFEAIAGLPGGDLYAVGLDSERPGTFSLEHWTDEKETSVGVYPLPSWFCTGPGTATAADGEVALVTASPSSVFVLCKATLGAGIVRFDGKDLHVIAPPTSDRLAGAAVGDDGTLWLATPSAAFALDERGVWRELAVPAAKGLEATIVEGYYKPEPPLHVELDSVASVGAGQALVAGSLYDKEQRAQSTFLFATDERKLELPKSDKQPTPLPSGSAVPAPPGESAEGGALGPDCKTPFVVLYSVSDSAPVDYAYPATRDALAAEHPKPVAEFVELRFKRHRALGAKVKTAADAKALVEVISKRVKGSKPTALCLDPTPALIRSLKL
jgi:hypothetical protein